MINKTLKIKAYYLVIILLLFTAFHINAFAAKDKIITDMAGRKVKVPRKINRIVAVYGTCNISTIMSALGVANKLVAGLCFKFPGDDLQLKVEPYYKKIDSLRFSSEGIVNLENLLALKPDVVFVWKGYVKNIDAIEAAGIPVIVSYSTTWEDLKKWILLIGDLTDAKIKAGQLVDYLDGMIVRIKTKTDSIPADKRKKVLLIENFTPLKVPGNEGFGGFLIENAGGISVSSKLPGYMPEMSVESIYAADPDVIIVSGFHRSGFEAMAADSKWSELRAVKAKNYYLGPRGVFIWNKANIEAGLYLLWQASKLYPDIISDKEVREEAVKFYKTFFNYDISKEEIEELFDHM